MRTFITVPRKKLLFSLEMIKCHLRVTHNEHDMLLLYLMSVATDWVENELGKTLINQTRGIIHDNNSFCLPFGPVIKILEVKYHKKNLEAGQYTTEPKADTLRITVPFRWKSPNVEVIYEAGFGAEPENVPPSLQHAVLGTIEYLFEHKGDTHALQNMTAPWLHAHRSYRIL